MKLLNVDYVVSNNDVGIYVLGKLYRIIEGNNDWVELLKKDVVHISRVHYAGDDCLNAYGELPDSLSEIIQRNASKQ